MTAKATTAESRGFRRVVALPVRLLVAFDGTGAERRAWVAERIPGPGSGPVRTGAPRRARHRGGLWTRR
jgi:hypothetical protein